MVTTTDAAKARRELESKSSSALNPVLTTQEVTDLLEMAEVTDAAGVSPGGAGYIPTYTTRSINGAASEAWRRKAGKVANQYTVGGGPGKNLNRSDMHKHCLQMASYYGRTGGIGVINLVTPAYTDTLP